MPPRFTDEERTRITDALLAAGYELFTTQGLRKTSLDDLAGRAGIAKSSFYAFFDSKEQLYLELLIRQAPEIVAQWVPRPENARDARSALVNMINDGRRTGTNDPLYRRLMTHPDELEAVTRRVGDEEITRLRPVAVQPLIDLFEGWRAEGQVVDADPELLIGILRAAALIAQHRKDFGDQYEQVAELLADVIATGLTTKHPKGTT